MKKYPFMRQSTIIAVTKITWDPIPIQTSKSFYPHFFQIGAARDVELS